MLNLCAGLRYDQITLGETGSACFKVQCSSCAVNEPKGLSTAHQLN